MGSADSENRDSENREVAGCDDPAIAAFDINEWLTPQWLRDVDPLLRDIITNSKRTAAAFGTMLGLFEYCRTSMSRDDWEYVYGSLMREFENRAR